MTKEEAIQMIQNDMRLHHDYLSGDYRKALRMAIEALQQPEIVRCEDCKKCQIETLCYDYWCDGKKVWKDHYCGYAERREG